MKRAMPLKICQHSPTKKKIHAVREIGAIFTHFFYSPVILAAL